MKLFEDSRLRTLLADNVSIDPIPRHLVLLCIVIYHRQGEFHAQFQVAAPVASLIIFLGFDRKES